MSYATKVGKTREAIKLLRNMEALGYYTNVGKYGTIIARLCKDARVREAALDLFSEMKTNGISYRFQALDLFKQMEVCNLKPSVYAYSSLINGYCSRGEMVEARKVFDVMIREGCVPNVYTYNILINGYCKKKNMDEAEQIVREMSHRGLDTGVIEDEGMVCKGLKLDVVTYNSLITGYCLRGEMDEARKVFEVMISEGCLPDVYTYNILINGYCKKKNMDEAEKIVREMSLRGVRPDAVTYNSLINGMCLSGKLESAKEYFEKIFADGYPTHIAYSTLLSGFLYHGNLDKALELFQAMKNSRTKPNLGTYLEDAKDLLSSMYSDCLLPDVKIWTSIIGGLCNEGLFDEARNTLRRMEDEGCPPDHVTYNVIIKGFLRHKNTSGALQLIDEMRDRRFAADKTTMDLVTDLLREDGNLDLKKALGICSQ